MKLPVRRLGIYGPELARRPRSKACRPRIKQRCCEEWVRCQGTLEVQARFPGHRRSQKISLPGASTSTRPWETKTERPKLKTTSLSVTGAKEQWMKRVFGSGKP